MVSLIDEYEIQELISLDLVQFCIRENVPFTEFEDWTSIFATVKDIVAGKTTVEKVAAAGAHEANKT
jgi:hypothetical protein